MKTLMTCVAVAAVVLAGTGSARAAIDLSGMTYLGAIDCSAIKQGSSLNDLVYANGELFVADYGGTVTSGRVYSIGLPDPGATVTSVVRTLGGGDPHTARVITYIAADDQVHWFYASNSAYPYTTLAQCEDRTGGNLESYRVGAPGDDRNAPYWGQGVDGRGMSTVKSGKGSSGTYGQYAYSWDKYFANQTSHGKMLCQAVPSGSYPECYDATIGTVFGKLCFLVINNDSYNGDSKRYLEAGEMTWDGAKWVVPATSESLVEIGSLAAEFRSGEDGAGTPRVTVGDGKLYILNTSTDHIHVFQVPEPATMGLLALGTIGLAALRRRRK